VLTQQTQMEFYMVIQQMQDAANRNRLVNWLTGTDTQARTNALYAWINHQKYEWLAQVSEENPLDTGYFAWIDSGAGHGHIAVPQHFCPCNIAEPGTATVFFNEPAVVHRQTPQSDMLFAPSANWAKYRLVPRGPLLAGFPVEWERPLVPLDSLSTDFYVQHAWHHNYFDEIILGTFWGEALMWCHNLIIIQTCLLLAAGGDEVGLKLLYADYKRIFYALLEADLVDIDQVLLALVASENPRYLRALPSHFYGVADLC